MLKSLTSDIYPFLVLCFHVQPSAYIYVHTSITHVQITTVNIIAQSSGNSADSPLIVPSYPSHHIQSQPLSG